MSDPKESNKERVLHTRVPEALEAEIKALADALRVPVSGLVRNILEDSVKAINETAAELDETVKTVKRNVETMKKNRVADKEGLRRGWTEFQTRIQQTFKSSPKSASPKETKPPRPNGDPFAGVFGWQQITLNVDAQCAACHQKLTRGATTHLGLKETAGPRVLACDDCLPDSQR